MAKALPAEQGLAIRALGAFDVSVGPRRIEPDAWQLRKAASLFKYLAIKESAWIPREELLETFWAELRPENAERAFRTTVHVLRKVLQPNLPRYAPSAYVEHRDALYRLRPEAIRWFDVQGFQGAIRRFQAAQLQSDRGTAIVAAREAIDLYGGALYPDEPYEDWAIENREALHHEYLDIVEAFARLTLGAGDPATHLEAVQVLRRAVQTAEEREALYLLLMKHLASLGRPGTALGYFRRYAKMMREELGTSPGLEITQLADQLRQRTGPAKGDGWPWSDGGHQEDAAEAAAQGLATSVAYMVDVRTFRKMVAWEQRKVDRLGTQSSLVLLRIAGPGKAASPAGGPRAKGTESPVGAALLRFQPWQQAVVERLRRADIATLPDPGALALLLPETDADGVLRVLDRLRSTIALATRAEKARVTLRPLAAGARPKAKQFALTLR